ncbi:MAG: GNAT family N-acetyltransferase [Pseudomonadales bacterium]
MSASIKYTVELLGSIDQVSAEQWNALNSENSPFTRHEFLHAMEASGSVCTDTGWQACHAAVFDDQQTLVAAMPAYVKSHSYGEYVFDWSWANAYQRAGRDYYPKILTAVPFSPVTGKRFLCCASEQENTELPTLIFEKFKQLASSINASSWHVLFPDDKQATQLGDQGLLRRLDCQYHWFNDDFEDFDEFLASFASRKRKNLRKERKRVAEQGIELQQLSGFDIQQRHWEDFYQFYHMTYYKRGGAGYLNREFFELIAKSMPDQLVMVMASRDQQAVGAALCFKDEHTLYGRYWGCAEEFEYLHFEACYYQGIDYCIKHKLQHFDPGAQGQHKIQRGFVPVFTHSCHWLADEDFELAVDRFLREETENIRDYRVQACDMLPFNSDYVENPSIAKRLGSGAMYSGLETKVGKDL